MDLRKGGIDLKFAYSDVRVKSMKNSLLRQNILRDLVAVPTLNEFIAILENTSYKDSMVDASTRLSGMNLIESAFNLELGKVFGRLLKITPPSHSSLLGAVLLMPEIQNVKTLIAKKHFNQAISRDDLVIFSKNGFEKLFETSKLNSVEEIANSFKSKSYFRALAIGMDDFRKSNSLTGVFDQLDKFYYANLREQLSNSGSSIVDLINLKIQIQDALIALRLKEAKAGDGAEKYLLKQKGWLVNSILKSQNVSEGIDTVARKFHLNKNCSTLEGLEVELDKEFAKRALKLTRSTVLNFGTILGFYFLKLKEISILRKIALAKEYSLSEKMREMVFSVAE